MLDARFIAMHAWIAQTLGAGADIELISGDASFRRYFRVKQQENSFVVMDSPPELVAVEPFVALADAYRQQGLNVPKIIAADMKQGFLLLNDLGDVQLLNVLNSINVDGYYRQALQLLDSVAGITEAQGEIHPCYDGVFALNELQIFSQWLIEHHLQLVLDPVAQQQLDDTYRRLIDNVDAQPKVGIHRDYHSRNLMLCDDRLAIIDFQDTMIGPITYDAVSLLRDCYIRWPDTVVDSLIEVHYRQMQQAQYLSTKVTLDQYRYWFDLMGVQRHLKAAGIFCRLNYRDNKPGYMKDIPLTLQYVSDIAKKYSELNSFGCWLDNQLLPLLEIKC